jgi:response regulator RpfG family c-di-GMP phosphodiesterase
MLYDNSNPLQRENFLARANLLAKRGEVVELRSKRQRTLNQNAYLHVLLSYFAVQYGETADYVKDEYFKKLVNPNHFVVSQGIDKFTGRPRIKCKSTSDLTIEEMSVCIDRFRNWSSKEAGIYLPTAEEGILLRQCEIEISQAERYL